MAVETAARTGTDTVHRMMVQAARSPGRQRMLDSLMQLLASLAVEAETALEVEAGSSRSFARRCTESYFAPRWDRGQLLWQLVSSDRSSQTGVYRTARRPMCMNPE